MIFNMYNNYDNYDVDNVDLEEEMYLRDIQEEQEQEEQENSDDNSSDNETEETIEEDSSSDTVSKKKNHERAKTVKITEAYLTKQLAYNIENLRDNIKFIYEDNIYIGKVISKFKDDMYIFDARLETEDTKKLKKFKLSKIKKYSK